MSSCRLTMDWPTADEQPRPGTWLKAAKGRTAYEITDVQKTGRPTKAWVIRYRLTCERHPASEIPEGATVFEISWRKRGRR